MEISFNLWLMRAKEKYRKRTHEDVWRGRGVRGAYECGAEFAMKNWEGNPYQRTDCYQAFLAGWMDMKKELDKGTTIICDHCGSKISR